MRNLILALSVGVFVLSSSAFAALKPQREQLYHCFSETSPDEVEGLKVYKSSFGQKSFYEIEVLTLSQGQRASFFKKVYLNSTYGGRILTFGTGNFRLKIDHVYPTEGKFRSFARIPQFDIHSQDWSCKKS